MTRQGRAVREVLTELLERVGAGLLMGAVALAILFAIGAVAWAVWRGLAWLAWRFT